jgi:hypothetical protein
VLNVATVTIAILQVLQADAALRLLLPDGVFFAEARPGSTRFVIVSLVSSAEVPMFGGPAYKDAVYLVEARALTTSATSTDVENAFARITTLLTDADLVIPGYGAMLTQFEEELETVEVDDIDPSIRWNRCGGHLHVMVAPSSTTATL